MWLFFLSLLTTESVMSATIGSPYRPLWAYNPIKSGPIHGYLRYLDNTDGTGIVSYNSAQPVYAVRQIKYVNSAAPALETIAINDSDEIIKARESYLRAASLQQYQKLKSDIDALKAEGKEPTAANLSKLQVLEKIAFSSDFSLIADLPELRSTLLDLEASVSGLYRKSVQQSANQQAKAAVNEGEIKTYVGTSNIPLVVLEETLEQKQARENHLRIYNEQIAHLKLLESKHQKYVQEASSKSNEPQSLKQDKRVDNEKVLADLERAQQEHFRIWNEAKLRAEQAGSESGDKRVYDVADKQQISVLKNKQNINSVAQPKLQNPETIKVRLEQKRSQNAISAPEPTQQFNNQANLKNEQIESAHIRPEQQHVVNTPEVERAREEYFRIVNEAFLQGQTERAVEEQQNIRSDSKEEKSKVHSESPSMLNYRAEQIFIEETPEVKKAREEHLRLVEEANLRAKFVEQQESKYKHESQTPILRSQYEHQQQLFQPVKVQNAQQIPEVTREHEGQLRVLNEFNEQHDKQLLSPSQPNLQQFSQAQFIEETAEVQRAREEHLRIFNSIKSHTEQEKAKQNSRAFSQQEPTSDYLMEEERLLALERIREVERLQKEQQLLDLDRLREVERLDEEKRQMEAELTRLKSEEDQRLEMERKMEENRLKQEQEVLRKLNNGEYQEIIIQADSADQQTQTNPEQPRSQQNAQFVEQQPQLYAKNPYLRDGQVPLEANNALKPSVSQSTSLPKIFPAQNPSNTNQHNSLTPAHHSGANKPQYVKYNYDHVASSQPADTAVALIALEKATNDHFRAHELALEQLRLARIQNSPFKDCN